MGSGLSRILVTTALPGYPVFVERAGARNSSGVRRDRGVSNCV
jgi:hypothetical protein